MTQVDDIKNRLDIIDIISEYVQLKPAGTNHKALCPFHSEKTPSFMVSKERQIFKCFGCNAGGDVFEFIMKIEGMEFKEALKLLADKAGVKLQYQDPKIASQKNTLLEIIEKTANFWHYLLIESPKGQAARDYLKNRKITDEAIEEFKLGYSPNAWDETIKFLLEREFKDNDIFLAGLTIKKDRGSGFYDRFRGRLMFPIYDSHGRTVGFGGRSLDAEAKEAKYINSPQTLIYNKSMVVYNLDKAKSAIREKELAIVVEGYMDIIASWQAEVRNVVASSGTAFTEEQLKIIKRYSENIAYCFDTDAAGVAAAFRGIELALGNDVNLKVISLPHGKDPDECIKKNPNDFLQAIADAKQFMEFYFEKVLAGRNLADVAQKKQVAKILLNIINKLNNKIEQTHWLQKLSEIINVPDAVLREALPQERQKKAAPQEGLRRTAAKSRQLMLEEQLLAILLKFPQHIAEASDYIMVEHISDEKLRNIYKNLIIYYTKNREQASKIDPDDFNNQLKSSLNLNDNAYSDYIQTLILFAEKDFFNFDSLQIRQELASLIKFIKKEYLLKKYREISARLKIAEANRSETEIGKIFEEFTEISRQIKDLDG